MTDTRLRAAQGLDLEQGERRAASPTSTARSPGRRTTRSCRSAAIRLQLYSLATPNGVKVTIMLEELLALGHSGAEYDAWLIKIGDGDQFGSGFVEVNPNSKIPALVDRSGPTPIRVFESGAILVYLAEKFGAFLPTEPASARRMPVVAVLADGQRALSRRRLRPFLRLCADQDRIRHRPLRDGGEAPARRARPAPRRQRLSRRRRLHDRRHRGLALVRRRSPRAWLYGAGEFLSVQDYKNVQRWADADRASARRCKRGRMVNRVSGEPASQLHERHDASDFETKTQDKIAPAAI